MGNARLLSLKLERFKSYAAAEEITFAPLTVILGRNNSGKSSIIQALLLLKQTLALPRPEVPLHLEGFVDALSLREITYGWPAAGPDVPGPTIGIRWSSRIDIQSALDAALSPDLNTFSKNTGLAWIRPDSPPQERTTELVLSYSERDGRTVLAEISLASFANDTRNAEARFRLTRDDAGRYECRWARGDSFENASALEVDVDHFLPYLLIDRRNVGPRDRQRSWHNAFLILFAQPLDDLRGVLSSFAYLGSMRTLPPTLYRPATVPPDDIGISGEYAAQMLHSRQSDRVHYLPPLAVDENRVVVPPHIRSTDLVSAVNDVLNSLGVATTLKIEDVKDVGFRLLFGQASLQHVGRGLSYLLPVIQLGLVTDPLRFEPKLGEATRADYDAACPSYTHCAFEEPEAHLHPKIQTRLAHWFVALAMSRRQVLVETHSDHLVRRLRGLAARAEPGGELEAWLLENARVLQVEQHDGRTLVKTGALTETGGLESWPADFMEEATGEERSIYNASLDKTEAPAAPRVASAAIVHDEGKEPDLDQ